MHQPRDRCQEEKIAEEKIANNRGKSCVCQDLLEMSPLLDGENSGPQLVGGEILDQCADERNENDPGPHLVSHHREERD
jgi:hypothetical protein